MTNISKKELKKEVSQRIHNSFITTIVKLNGRKGKIFIEELFTPAEKVMFAKRLAAILMLAQGISAYKISKLLRLSFSTTARMRISIKNGEYSSFRAIVCRKKEKEQLWTELEVFIRLGMPEMGKNRWKWLDEIFPK